MRITWILLALSLGLSPLALRADVAAAKAAYDQGLALERAKDYQGAIAKYDAALAAEPRYAWANRQKGTCYYMLGKKADSLAAYDAYLAVVKNDAKTKAFADRLRKEVPAGAAASAGGGGRKWRVAPTLGYTMLSFKDWNDAVKPTTTAPSTGTATYPTVSSGLTLGLGFGYSIKPALELGLDLDYFLVSAKSTYKDTGTDSSTDYGFNLLYLGPQVTYTFARVAGGKLGINGGLGLGMGTLMGSSSGKSTSGSFSSSSKGSYSGSGFGFKLKLGMDYAFTPGFGLGLDLGYRILSVSKVAANTSYTNAAGVTTEYSGTLQTFSSTGSPKDLPLDYSGIDLKLGANFRF